jgi:hypothetical protein
MVGKLIGVTTMRAGLTVNAKLDKKQNAINVKATNEELVSANLGSYASHGEWTYAIRPSRCICRPVDSPGLARLVVPADLLTPDWVTPLNQPVSLPASSQH